LKKALGAVEEAKAAYLEAHALSQPYSFMRYVHELCLGSICESQNKIDEALSWYKSALTTSNRGEGIAGGSALQSFLKHRPQEELTAEERALCAAVAEKSWKLLRLPGQADLRDLARTTLRLIEAQSKPLKQ
jgi:hypothetical protein